MRQLLCVVLLLMVAACEARPPDRSARHDDPEGDIAFVAGPEARAPRAPQVPQAPVVPPRPPPAPAPAAGAPGGAHGGGWNPDQIAWRDFDEGLREARERGVPTCLVIYTAWCPHCRNYSHVFEDPRIVERSRDFVMIRIDADQRPDVGGRFALDGQYIPRTYFLGPDGTVAAQIQTGRPRYRYFYDENDPSSLLRAMEQAAAHFAG